MHASSDFHCYLARAIENSSRKRTVFTVSIKYIYMYIYILFLPVVKYQTNGGQCKIYLYDRSELSIQL